MKSEVACAARTENPLQFNSMDIPSPSEADDNKSRMTDNVPKIMGVDKYVGQQMKTSLNLPHWRVLQRGLRSQQRLTEKGHVMEEVRKVSLYFYQCLSKPVKM
ncbi:unnamed protein product [Sphagnum balticum]